ncbi:hypothetical protein QUB05_10935 [Microcoleus sp. F10-C6]|uniref:hypothetical protein n=1 Tax=unclassified Microcoleus TaxID=2642155 RepID=UPI002FD3D34D
METNITQSWTHPGLETWFFIEFTVYNPSFRKKNPVSQQSCVQDYNRGYQQALNNFGITQLLSGIGSYV